MAIKRNIILSNHIKMLNWHYGAGFFDRQMMIFNGEIFDKTYHIAKLWRHWHRLASSRNHTRNVNSDIVVRIFQWTTENLVNWGGTDSTTAEGASSSGSNPTRKKRQALSIISSQHFSSFVIRSQWHDRCVHTTESPYTCPQTTSWHCTW